MDLIENMLPTLNIEKLILTSVFLQNCLLRSCTFFDTKLELELLEETDGKLENHVKIMRRPLFIFTIIR